MMSPIYRRAGLCLLVCVAMAGGAEAASLNKTQTQTQKAVQGIKTCPSDALTAARQMWVLGRTMGKNQRRLDGKHRCGRWLRCVKRDFTRSGWQCNWTSSDSKNLKLKGPKPKTEKRKAYK
ncbi:hypothetical protein [Cohaesibacter celericrescens]|uniref:Uncharacterized protein n=1 Tax=Cohaesibacter celericrescens TaxID=2067669 RepID=A0A2N5XMX4_9HYPH|nr:hypothetical protein [Cohaesibacter celericrescens]PLW75842.1 hypothetical protein C0081_17210 [Cohaesibacter celericrescens]